MLSDIGVITLFPGYICNTLQHCTIFLCAKLSIQMNSKLTAYFELLLPFPTTLSFVQQLNCMFDQS